MMFLRLLWHSLGVQGLYGSRLIIAVDPARSISHPVPSCWSVWSVPCAAAAHSWLKLNMGKYFRAIWESLLYFKYKNYLNEWGFNYRQAVMFLLLTSGTLMIWTAKWRDLWYMSSWNWSRLKYPPRCRRTHLGYLVWARFSQPNLSPLQLTPFSSSHWTVKDNSILSSLSALPLGRGAVSMKYYFVKVHTQKLCYRLTEFLWTEQLYMLCLTETPIIADCCQMTKLRKQPSYLSLSSHRLFK